MNYGARRTTTCAMVLAAAVALGACGSDDSQASKPQYCADRAKLEQSIKDLGSVNVAQSGGLQQLKSQLSTVETNARSLATSAKSDFPTESSAISASVTTLKDAVDQLPSSPSPSQVVLIGTSTKAVVTSVQAFEKATDSKCD